MRYWSIWKNTLTYDYTYLFLVHRLILDSMCAYWHPIETRSTHELHSASVDPLTAANKLIVPQLNELDKTRDYGKYS